MNDLAIGFFLGACAVAMISVLVLLVWRWQRGSSRDTLPDGAVSTTAPDLSRAVAEYQLFDAARRVLAHTVPMAQVAATTSRDARWRMATGDGRGSVELPIRDQFFLDVERLDIAVRAYEGAELSDHDKAVLAGVLAPNRFGTDPLPPLLLNDAT